MSADSKDNRPLSPYMFGSLYRWQISSITSSIHRVTGIALFFSFVILAFWLIGAAAGGGWWSFGNWLVSSWIGKLVLFLSLWAMWFHFLNGIRHLAWDFGQGFSLEIARITGYTVIIASIVMTIITAIIL